MVVHNPTSIERSGPAENINGTVAKYRPAKWLSKGLTSFNDNDYNSITSVIIYISLSRKMSLIVKVGLRGWLSKGIHWLNPILYGSLKKIARSFVLSLPRTGRGNRWRERRLPPVPRRGVWLARVHVDRRDACVAAIVVVAAIGIRWSRIALIS